MGNTDVARSPDTFLGFSILKYELVPLIEHVPLLIV